MQRHHSTVSSNMKGNASKTALQMVAGSCHRPCGNSKPVGRLLYSQAVGNMSAHTGTESFDAMQGPLR